MRAFGWELGLGIGIVPTGCELIKLSRPGPIEAGRKLNTSEAIVASSSSSSSDALIKSTTAPCLEADPVALTAIVDAKTRRQLPRFSFLTPNL